MDYQMMTSSEETMARINEQIKKKRFKDVSLYFSRLRPSRILFLEPWRCTF
jgi:hypothetical protein